MHEHARYVCMQVGRHAGRGECGGAPSEATDARVSEEGEGRNYGTASSHNS